MNVHRLSAVVALAVPLSTGVAVPGDLSVDVALVLAVDVSQSVSATEARVQREGYAAAFESADVIAAIVRGFQGRIAVSYVEWSSPDHQNLVVDWTIVDGADSAAKLADRLRGLPPKSGGTTSIASGLAYSEHLLDRVPWEPERRVIDISGDGRHNFGRGVDDVRRRIVERGIVINGLPVGSPTAEGFDVIDYYERNVIGGAGAFLVAAAGINDFAPAVRTKIAFEIAGRTPPSAAGATRYALLAD